MWRDILDSQLPLRAQVTVLAYPVFYVSAAMVMLQSVLAGAMDLGRNRGMAAVVLAGLILEAVGFIVWCPQLLANTYTPGATPIDALWTVGLIGIGSAPGAPGPSGASAASRASCAGAAASAARSPSSRSRSCRSSSWRRGAPTSAPSWR